MTQMKPQPDSTVVRVETRPIRLDSTQLSLFARHAADVQAEMGVRPIDADRLFEAGLLSFDPRTAEPLGSAEAAELRFLLSLHRAGCDLAMIRALVAELEPPYCYDHSAMVYDFAGGRWLGLARVDAGESAALAVSLAAAQDDPQALAGLAHAAIDALRERLATGQEE
ncbi:hypothetical protein L6R53_20015 [Myxococcota bacterium]|nr:hypothetical protein [Myxococcota bacterium]